MGEEAEGKDSIVAVGIVIVLLSDEGGGSLEFMCAGVAGGQNSVEWISCRCFLYGYSYSFLYSRVQCY